MNNISVVSETVELPTLSVIYAAEKDMLLFLELASKLWPTVVPEGAVYIQPFESWAAPHEDLADKFKILTRQLALPHAPFADMPAHSVVPCQQQKVRKLLFLNIQSYDEFLLDIIFFYWNHKSHDSFAA